MFCSTQLTDTMAAHINVVCPPCPQAVPRFAYVTMDNDNERMPDMLMKEEANAAADQEERMIVMSAILS
jgi:hypothetical protein